MLDQYLSSFMENQNHALEQYCKMEHVVPSSLKPAKKPKTSIKLSVQSASCHTLKRINHWLEVVIIRLSADIEHGRNVQRRLS